MFLLSFIRSLQVSNAWKYRVPILISLPYFFLGLGGIGAEATNVGYLASLCTIIGFLSLRSLLNGWLNQKRGIPTDKTNVTSNWSGRKSYIVFFCSALLAFVPWVYLPVDAYSAGAIGVEISLFCLFTFRPFQFNEKGIVGTMLRAVYSCVLPAIIASYTLYLFTGKSFVHIKEFLAILIIWQFTSGVRNLLHRQVLDYKPNSQNKVQTSVANFSLNRTKFILGWITVPLEIISFAGFLALISNFYWFIWIIAPLGIIAGFIQIYKARKSTEMSFYEKVICFSLDNLYVIYLPLIPLSGLFFVEMSATAIIVMHLLIFPSVAKHILVGIARWLQGTRIESLLFGYSSYLKGIFVHLLLASVYIAIFSFVYFWLKDVAESFEQFIWLQKLLGRLLVVLILMHLSLVILMRKEQTLKMIQDFFSEVGSPQNLAIFRIFVFLLIIGSFIGEVFGEFANWTYLDDSHRVGLPMISWFTDLIPINPNLYFIVSIIGLVLAISILFGFKTRYALLAYVPIALYLWGVPNLFGKLNHRHIMVWVPIILSMSRCGDVLSIDYLIQKYRNKKPKPQASVEYALPLKFVWITIAIIYCCSGFHKLWDAGLHWALSDNLRNQILLEWVEQYDQVKSIRIDHFPILLRFGAMTVILVEILFPLLIFKPYLRPFALFSSWSLHLSAGYFLTIDFVQLRFMNLSFVNWSYLKQVFKRTSREKVPSSTYDFNKFRSMPFMYVVVPLVTINLLFGILQINSWPFSGYPAYSNIVSDKVTLIRMDVQTADSTQIDVKRIAQNQDFRWENLRPFEERIMAKYTSEDTTGLSVQLEEYWQLWDTKLSGLEEVERIEMYFETTSIIPEKRKLILDNGYLGTVIEGD